VINSYIFKLMTSYRPGGQKQKGQKNGQKKAMQNSSSRARFTFPSTNDFWPPEVAGFN